MALNNKMMQCQSVACVQEICESHLLSFDSINLASAIHRVAKLADQSTSLDEFAAVLAKTVDGIRHGQLNSQCLANAAWTPATLLWHGQPVLAAAWARCQTTQLAGPKAQEIANAA
ncbi:unnamed protein product [Effrenium voratum]|nr:unnamed protein product [Effrenium voratum]